MMVRRLFWLAVVGALAAAMLLRPVAVRGDRVDSTVWLWAWQDGSASFTNSVTNAPVRIDFRFVTGLDHFSMTTDEATEHYYTSGSYDIDQRLLGQRTDALQYCSMVGITVRLARRLFQVTDGCLEIKALWPPQVP